MDAFTLDRTGLIFYSLSLVLMSWAVFDTQRFLRFLSYNRRTEFADLQLMAIRVPGTICILGTVWMIVITLCHTWGLSETAWFFAAGGALIGVSRLILLAMLRRVNRTLPADRQIGSLWLYPGKGIRIGRDYERIYPRSHLNAVRIILGVLAAGLILAGLATFGR
jgi:hypothetical protein